jgi:hypothetical protein
VTHAVPAKVRHHNVVAAFDHRRRDATPGAVVGEQAVDQDRRPLPSAQLGDVKPHAARSCRAECAACEAHTRRARSADSLDACLGDDSDNIRFVAGHSNHLNLGLRPLRTQPLSRGFNRWGLVSERLTAAPCRFPGVVRSQRCETGQQERHRTRARFSEMERKEAGKDGSGVSNGKPEITIIPDAFFWTGLRRGFSPRTRAAGMWSAPLPVGLRDRAHPPHTPLHWTLSTQRLGACPRRQDLHHQADEVMAASSMNRTSRRSQTLGLALRRTVEGEGRDSFPHLNLFRGAFVLPDDY